MSENRQLSAEEPKGELLVYRSEDGQIKLEVRLENETVWLAQKMMADLFPRRISRSSGFYRSLEKEGRHGSRHGSQAASK